MYLNLYKGLKQTTLQFYNFCRFFILLFIISFPSSHLLDVSLQIQAMSRKRSFERYVWIIDIIFIIIRIAWVESNTDTLVTKLLKSFSIHRNNQKTAKYKSLLSFYYLYFSIHLLELQHNYFSSKIGHIFLCFRVPKYIAL